MNRNIVLSSNKQSPSTSRNTQVLSVSLAPEVYKQLERLARSKRRSKSRLVSDMIVEYSVSDFRKQWAKVRKMGEEIRKEYKFKNEDELFEYIHGD